MHFICLSKVNMGSDWGWGVVNIINQTPYFENMKNLL